MAKWARIIDDLVVETTDIDPEGRFHPDLVWAAVPDEVEPGMVKKSNDFVTAELPALLAPEEAVPAPVEAAPVDQAPAEAPAELAIDSGEPTL